MNQPTGPESSLPILNPDACMAMVSSTLAYASLLTLAIATLAIETCSISLPGDTANLSTVWTSPLSSVALLNMFPGSFNYMLQDGSSPAFAAGLYDTGSNQDDRILFGVYTVCVTNVTTFDSFEVGYYMDYSYSATTVLWSANRDHLLQTATLNFTADGDLLLQDIHGNPVWSTNTSGQSVAGITLTDSGNLVLFDHNNHPVWQSFDHPTDCLLPGQRLVEGMRLTPNTSATEWSASNLFYLTVLFDGLYAFAGSSPPQPYYHSYFDVENSKQKGKPYVSFTNRSLGSMLTLPPAVEISEQIGNTTVSFQFLRFESDGHLRLYEWKDDLQQWSLEDDVFKMDACGYPSVCGDYGVCSNGQCICPVASDTGATYFKQTDSQRPNLGCTLLNPISCQSLSQHQLIGIANVSSFVMPVMDATFLLREYGELILVEDEESCKLACLRNCSCRAALFVGNFSRCFLLQHVFSLQANTGFKSAAYLKVQLSELTNTPPSGKHKVLLGSIIAGVIFSLMTTFTMVVSVRRRLRKDDDENDFSDLAGMPTRFDFKVLKVATQDFSNKLGQGGFGSVFEGLLHNERVAVKCLDRADSGRKEFLAEVQTIGSLHHINLVRLIGFCAEKSYRLLVFEYMPRGSLDMWIYKRDNFVPLDWHTRRKIITDIARGLSYLHEDCRQRIAHLDIKPQNILLDENFNAKIADFGLAKMIDRGESHVMTRMRGTPGYMAPEWLTSQITEKVDVYSFGIVVMEIISGRKNLDYSQDESSVQLIILLQDKVKNDLLEDMIDRSSDDMHLHKEEVIETIKLAMWCLQSDKNRRPEMSTVVKVMEGERSVESNLDYNFFDLSPAITVDISNPPVVSVLSAPR